MTRPPDLTAAEMPDYLGALNTHSLQRVDFHLLNLDHTHLTSLHPLALDGQVNFNADSAKAVARTFQGSFIDPDHALMLDADSPTDGMGGMNKLLRVRHSTWVGGLDRWVSVDVFTGQPMIPKRDGATIELTCHDKSARHLRFAPPSTIRKGTPIVTAIQAGLRAAGEHHFKFPSVKYVKARVGRDIPVGGSLEARQPWQVYSRLAKSIGYQLFYDGSGTCVMRKIPANTAAMTWRASGPSANIIGTVASETDHTGMRNRAVVTSHRTIGKKERKINFSHASVLPAAHAYSAQSLKAGGVPWTNTDYNVNDDLENQTQVNRSAAARLKQNTKQTLKLLIPVLPVFHLDPLDIGRIETDDATWAFPIQEASIPVLDDGSNGMSIGQQRWVRKPIRGLAA